MTRLHIGFISALFLTLTLTASAGASNDIRIATWITPENGPAPGQKLDLNIKVATLEKLESGVRIEDLVLPDAVVLQRQKFATNATEIRNGQTWNVQDWTVSIFPLKAGDIFIPSLEVQIPVKRVESGGSNFIKRQTKPRLITISRPPALRGLDQWIASPAFELRQTISANDDRIEPGSVIRRKIHLRADNVPGMLLPEPIQAPINGLREYPATSTSEDFEDRGQLIGRRSLEHTYVVEKTGTYALPEIRIAWWHTETKTLQWATVPAYSFVVSSVVSVKSPIGPFGIIGHSGHPHCHAQPQHSKASYHLAFVSWGFSTKELVRCLGPAIQIARAIR